MAFTGNPTEWACGFLLALAVLVLCLEIPPPAEAPTAEGGADAGALAGAVADWRKLWTAVASSGEEALRPGVDEPRLRAAGDTLLMRYPGLVGDLAPAARHRFQLSALSNDPALKLELLTPLRDHADPRVRHRAWLESARVRLRERRPAEAAEALDAALSQPVPPRWQADTRLMQAVVALAADDRPRAAVLLDSAIELDPGFWDARQLRLRVRSELLAAADLRADACLRHSRRLLEDLGALPALAQSHEQFRMLADRFASLGERGHPAFGLLAGLAYHWVGDDPAARRALQAGFADSRRLPAACAAELGRSGRELLARLPP